MRAIMLLPGVMSIFCVGCSTMDVMVQKQGEMEKRLESLAQSGTIRDQRVSDLSAELTALQRSTRQSREEVESLRATIADLRAVLERGGQSSSAVSKIEVVNRSATDREREAGPPEEYVKAFGLFSANSFSEAISAFEAFLLSSPSSEYAGNSHFWIGECHYAQKEFRKAISSFQHVVDHYPASAKVPEAMLKIASCHTSLKEPQRARQVMEQLVAKYPDTPAAIKARELLTRQ